MRRHGEGYEHAASQSDRLGNTPRVSAYHGGDDAFTLGVEQAAGREGWMHAAVALARPFRMPDFFLISGLFLARVIDRARRDYLDRKVLHFA